jgi:hypothetical protein
MFGALVIFVLIAGFFEGVMDTLQFHYSRSVFRLFKNQLFWDPEKSWQNKYKDGDFSKGPRFPFSTTFLVGLTDGWHMAKTFRNLSLFISLPLIGFSIHNLIPFIITIIIARSLYGFGFWISYNKLLVSR